MLFVGDWSFAPIRVATRASHSTGMALLINAGLITLFGLQRFVMARPTVKETWTKFVPQAIERSTYVLLSGIILAFVCYAWQPVGGGVWSVESPVGRVLLTTLQVLGWVRVVAASFMINHFELFGLQQCGSSSGTKANRHCCPANASCTASSANRCSWVF